MYPILSLDGGGTWSLIQVRILQWRYGADACGHDVLRNYRLVIANSGGAIVLAGLCLNMRLNEIRRLFENEDILREIFDKRFISSITGINRYKTESKASALRKYLRSENSGVTHQSFLRAIPGAIGHDIKIIITGFDYDRTRAIYFRSDNNSPMESSVIIKRVSNDAADAMSFENMTLLDAVHVSTNAPVVYFNKPAQYQTYANGVTYTKYGWGGAIGGNNNPVFAGVLEALSYGTALDDIHVVSLGTANTLIPVLYGTPDEPAYEYEWLVRYSHLENDRKEIKKMASAVISDPPDAATFNTFHLMRLPYMQRCKRLIRINPLIKPVLDENSDIWKMPGKNWKPADMSHLFEIDMATTSSGDIACINDFTDDFISGFVDNQGIRVGGRGLRAILGHLKFQDALDDWRTWD